MDAQHQVLIDDLNKRTMKQSVGEYFKGGGGLTPQEHAGLSVIVDEARGRPILDLGVGAGRTVPALTGVSKDYIGVDYVPEMVATCRQRFPEFQFFQADARDLSQFEDESFFLIVFSLNGICMVNHEGRMTILEEIFRLLKPGGALLFTSYNRNSSNYEAMFRFPSFFPTLNPVRLAVRGFRFSVHSVTRAVNRVRFRGLEKKLDEYSIINDACHNYAVMLYYTSLENHLSQLKSVGFDEISSFDQAGQRIETDTRDDSIAFLARKPG